MLTEVDPVNAFVGDECMEEVEDLGEAEIVVQEENARC
jgi:hypothetical protein